MAKAETTKKKKQAKKVASWFYPLSCANLIYVGLTVFIFILIGFYTYQFVVAV